MNTDTVVSHDKLVKVSYNLSLLANSPVLCHVQQVSHSNIMAVFHPLSLGVGQERCWMALVRLNVALEVQYVRYADPECNVGVGSPNLGHAFRR